MKRTEWYPPHIKPVRKGWYETKFYIDYRVKRDFWNGRKWIWFYNGERYVYGNLTQNTLHWRGLTEPAK